jgi:hypothetical protein
MRWRTKLSNRASATQAHRPGLSPSSSPLCPRYSVRHPCANALRTASLSSIRNVLYCTCAALPSTICMHATLHAQLTQLSQLWIACNEAFHTPSSAATHQPQQRPQPTVRALRLARLSPCTVPRLESLQCPQSRVACQLSVDDASPAQHHHHRHRRRPSATHARMRMGSAPARFHHTTRAGPVCACACVCVALCTRTSAPTHHLLPPCVRVVSFPIPSVERDSPPTPTSSPAPSAPSPACPRSLATVFASPLAACQHPVRRTLTTPARPFSPPTARYLAPFCAPINSPARLD